VNNIEYIATEDSDCNTDEEMRAYIRYKGYIDVEFTLCGLVWSDQLVQETDDKVDCPASLGIVCYCKQLKL